MNNALSIICTIPAREIAGWFAVFGFLMIVVGLGSLILWHPQGEICPECDPPRSGKQYRKE